MLKHRVDRPQWGVFLDRLTVGHADISGQDTAWLWARNMSGL